MSSQPPKWADRFLRWYCNPRFLEEIEGDIYELFDRRVERNHSIARLRFIWDVIRFFRWSNINRTNSNYTTMNGLMLFRNYLKTGMRNIRTNLVSSSINIFGLAIAIGFTISIFIFTNLQLNMDTFHKKGERIYQLANYIETEDDRSLWADSPLPLGPYITDNHPAIEASTRIEYRSAVVKQGSEVFDQLTVFVDPSFLHIFDFPLLSGSRNALHTKNNVIISRNMAIKYFSDADPIGQELAFKFLNGEMKRMVVGAVLDEYPHNASFTFDFLLPIENFADLNFTDPNDWSFMTDGTFVLLKEGESIDGLSASYPEIIELQHGSNPEWKLKSIEPFPLYKLSTKAHEMVGSIAGGGHPAGRIALVVISCLLLGMACFNFMNIGVVSASRRLKEIALRKVMGGVRKEIIRQFLTENLLQCFFALIIGILISYFLIVPWFDILIPEISIPFQTDNPYTLIFFLVSLLLLVGLVSGTYPALYISKFDTVTIFKGKLKFGSKNLFSKVMLGFQFFLAVTTIVGCFIMTEQNFYLAEKDWGYDPSGTMSVYVESEEQYSLFENEMMNAPQIVQYAGSDFLIGRGVPQRNIKFGDKKISARAFSVTEGFFDTFQLRIKEGRPLNNTAYDKNSAVVINETFAEEMGWSDPLGQAFSYDSVPKTVVGVVEDFHYYDFFSDIDPVMIQGLDPAKAHYITMRTTSENMVQLEEKARAVWQNIAPNDPFDRVFQEDAFDAFYAENTTNTTLLLFISSIAILLACLGLYGLLSFNVQGKLKEFSVRKVLGAEPAALIRIVSRQYFWVLLIAFVIGAPLGAWGMNALLISVFPDPKAMTIWPFAVAMSIILVTLIITIAGQISKAIKVNPAQLLRTE